MSDVPNKVARFAERLHALEQEWIDIKNEIDDKIAEMKQQLEALKKKQAKKK